MRELSNEECGLVAGADGEPGNDAQHKQMAEDYLHNSYGGSWSCSYSGAAADGGALYTCSQVGAPEMNISAG